MNYLNGLMNPLLDIDSYKASHWLQYPAGTQNLFNYMSSRGGAYDRTVFFGLQYLLEEYLTRSISADDVYEAEQFFKAHGVPFNLQGWSNLVNKHHGQGYIPLRIRAVPEGSVIPTGVPLLTAEATDPEFFWVVGWFETMLMRLWYPTTVATLSYHLKKTITHHMKMTCDDLSGLPFKLHDFGSRGVSSRESAAIGGAAHLVNFKGSDTIPGIVLAKEYYGAQMAGFSIPAAEHSTITSWGRDHEIDAYNNMLTQFAKPGAILAVVSDSYNIYEAAEKLWGETLRQKVIDSGATVVIRPDSGNPVTVVKRLLEILANKFGVHANSKGFAVLNHVRLIQGDGLTPTTIQQILEMMTYDLKFSTDNIAFGMGGGLLQQVNRDTLKFAYKCSAILKDCGPLGCEWFDVYKSPVDDPGKASLAGRVGTERKPDGTYMVCDEHSSLNILEPVFENGRLLYRGNFEDIRLRAEAELLYGTPRSIV